MKKRLGFFVILALLVGGGALVMMGEKSKGKVGLDAVLQVATDAQRDVDRIGFGLTRVSDAEEMKLGDEIAGRAGLWWGSAPPAELASYVDNLGQTLAAHVRRPGIKYTFHVVDSPDINAFALPGGQIFVLRGLINFAESESELAMIVGHEIAHALQEHGRERVGKQRLAQIGTVIASIGGALLGFGDLGGQVASGAAQLTLLKYGRDDETEADVIGLDLAARAAFDPRAGLVVWQKMAAVAKGQPPQWLSSHPSHATRIAEIGQELKRAMPLYARAIGKPIDQLPPYASNVGEPVPWPLATAKRGR